MIYIHVSPTGVVLAVADRHQPHPTDGTRWECRWEWRTFAMAKERAAQAKALTGADYMAFDNGPSMSPRYDIMVKPAVGNAVSYGFNGDYYPDGEIARISESLRVITTTTGKKYYRQGESGRWVQTGGTWSLVQGHHDERNPCF